MSFSIALYFLRGRSVTEPGTPCFGLAGWPAGPQVPGSYLILFHSAECVPFCPVSERVPGI